jgi:hypothetical protein
MWGRGIAILILKLSGKIYVPASLPLGRPMASTEQEAKLVPSPVWSLQRIKDLWLLPAYTAFLI